MKKFMALYMAPAAAIEKMMKATPEEMKEGMAAWKAWSDEYADDIVEGGTPLGKTMRVTADGAADAHNEVTCYTIVQGESHSDVARLFDGHPYLETPGAYIDILECVNMPGM